MQRDQMETLEEAKDVLKKAGVSDDQMAVLEKKLIPAPNDAVNKDSSRVLGFVSAGVQSSGNEVQKVTANKEDIELPEDSDSEDDEKVEIAQKDVPSAVFGGLAQKRKENDSAQGGNDVDEARDRDEGNLGALERFKLMKRGS